LHEAAKFSDSAILERLLQTDMFTIDARDVHERTPIFYSVIRGATLSVKGIFLTPIILEFLKKQAYLDAIDIVNTCYIFTIRKGNY